MDARAKVVEICKAAHGAQYALAAADEKSKSAMLREIAKGLRESEAELLTANAADVEAAKANGMSAAMTDRLTLTSARIAQMAEGVAQVADLPDPVGEVSEAWDLPNGLHIDKVRVPLGVIGVIYESRPNVTADVSALCLKSGNCVVLRGGKEAINSNRAIYSVIARAVERSGFDGNIVGFIDDVSREGSAALLAQGEYVDVVIPRGGDGLKKFVLENATMPVIASAGGVCHIYVEKSADFDKSVDVIENAKMQRPSTCNALEQLLVDADIAHKFLPLVAERLTRGGCRLTGCERSVAILAPMGYKVNPATEDDYRKEHLDYELTIRVVDGEDEAIRIINANNTKHSDGIMSQDKAAIDKFTSGVDAACVYANASTRFTDGFQFGFGAEIGISTQKLHARGPLGLRQLTSEKYVISGNGQVRK